MKFFKFNSYFHELLVLLMALQMILSQTVFHGFQQVIEVSLFLIFSYSLLTKGVSILGSLFISVLLITQILSVVINDVNFSAFLLNFKQVGLATLSLLYFKNSEQSKPCLSIFFIFVICLALVLVQKFITGIFPIQSVSYIVKNISIFNGQQPIGLFLDYHTTSYFLATFFIGYSLIKNLYFFDLLIIWTTGVRTTFLSLFGQKVTKKLIIIFPFLSLFFFQILLVVLGVYILLSILLPLFLSMIDHTDLLHGNSVDIMIKMISDSRVYESSLNALPRDVYQYYIDNVWDYTSVGGGEKRANEMALITIMVQGGLIFGLMLLYALTKVLPNYRIFIFLSLLHYSNVLNPLIIYMMFMFELHVKKEHK